MKNTKIYCENRESFYSFTTDNNVTKWTKDIKKAKVFNNATEAEDLISIFKNSAMNDTKYIEVI